MADLERFRERRGKRSRKDAVRELIRIGLRVAADKEAANEAT
jgi:metal-responsive CopG/Arc/MetJ family transcriptional regulator